MRLDFKFGEGVPSTRRQQVIETVKRAGADKVEPLFPDEADAELASLYKAEGVPDADADAVVSKLQQLDEVEFAEPTAERKLID